MFFRISSYIFSFYVLISSLLYGQEKINVTPEVFEDESSVQLYGVWKYHPRDENEWAEKNINTSSWQAYNPQIFPNSKISKEWKGVGWFRTTFRIDSTFLKKPFRVSFYSAGSIKFYYNGKLVYDQYAKSVKDTHIHSYVTITFDEQSEQTFAVRYQNEDISKFNDAGFMAGFTLYIGPVDRVTTDTVRYLLTVKSYQMFFLGITLAFCLLHLILFIYHPGVRSNLYFAIYLFLHAIGTYFDYAHTIQTNVNDFLINIRFHRLIMAISIIAILKLIYSIVDEKVTAKFWLLVIVIITAGILVYIKPSDNFIYLEIINLIAIAEIVHLFIKALRVGRTNIWLIITGFIIILIFSFYDLFMDFGWITPIYNITNGYPFGLIGLFVCISIYLAKDISNRNQIIVEQEKIVKEKEIQQKFLLKENEQKRFELEEARKLQVSMLPVCINNFPDYDICFDMRTATEVGGDYYDYDLGEDGTLNIVIGDATGHGAKAGLMVATFKSMFSALGRNPSIVDFFKKCNDIVVKMKLGNLYMAMTFVRLKNKEMEISNAGMPPALFYRKENGNVEEIIIKAMPLGAPLGLPYQLEKITLKSGDVILLLSDGLEELFNNQMEMFGRQKIKEVLVSCSELTSNQISAKLFAKGDEWRNSEPQKDDMTFVVIKVK